MIVTVEEEAIAEVIQMVSFRDAADPCVEYAEALAGLHTGLAALRKRSMREVTEAGEDFEPSDARFSYLDRGAVGSAGVDDDPEDIGFVNIDDLTGDGTVVEQDDTLDEETYAPNNPKGYIEDDDPPPVPLGRGRYSK